MECCLIDILIDHGKRVGAFWVLALPESAAISNAAATHIDRFIGVTRTLR
jgi:hypothetical protein